MGKAVRAIIIHDDQLLLMYRRKQEQEYYTLIGGGIESGETPEQALKREVMEETSFTVTGSRLVFVEELDEPYGAQYIFLCQIEGNEPPHLLPDSGEAQEFAPTNQHIPQWLPAKGTRQLPLLSDNLKTALVYALDNGFPAQAAAIDNVYIAQLQDLSGAKER